MSEAGEHTSGAPAGPLRRLGAVLYDALLAIAVLVVATVPFIPFIGDRVLVPQEVGALAYLYWGWQLLVLYGFFGYFWTHRGQTIGMLAWRLRIVTHAGEPLGWNDVARRVGSIALLWLPAIVGQTFIWGEWREGSAKNAAIAVSFAPLVLSYCWIPLDRARMAWHDRLSGTRILRKQ